MIVVMKMRFPPYLASTLLLSAAFVTLSPAAKADRPWQDVPVKAQVTDDLALTDTLGRSLVSLPDGSPFALNSIGKIDRIDPVDGGLSPLNDELPPFTALAGNAEGLWAVTQAPKPELLNLAPDTGVILNHINIGEALRVGSHVTAVQVTDSTAYLIDAGAPAFIIADLKTGHVYRLLDGSPSLSFHGPLMRHGRSVDSSNTSHATEETEARFIVLDHDQHWLFYQTPTGPLYRIGTSILTDTTLGPAEQIEAMTNWRRTPSLGALTLDRHDTFYMVDIDHGDLLAFGADRIPLRLLHDERLYQAKAMTVLKSTIEHKRKLAITLAPLPQPDTGSASSSSSPSDNHTHLLEIALP